MREAARCPHYADPPHACVWTSSRHMVQQSNRTVHRTSNLHSGGSLLHMQIDICSRTASPASHHVCDMQISQLCSLPSPPPPLSLPVSPQAGGVSRCAQKPKAQLQTSIIMMLWLVHAEAVGGVQSPSLLANNLWEKGQKNKYVCGMVDDYTTTLWFFFFPSRSFIKHSGPFVGSPPLYYL